MPVPLPPAPAPAPLRLPPLAPVPPAAAAARAPPDPTEISYTAYSPSPSSLAAWREKKQVVRDWRAAVDLPPDARAARAARPPPRPRPLDHAGRSVGVGSAEWSETSASSGTVPSEIAERRHRERVELRARQAEARAQPLPRLAGQARLDKALPLEPRVLQRVPLFVPVAAARPPPVPLLARAPTVPSAAPARSPPAQPLPTPPTSPPPDPDPGRTRAAREAYLASALSLPLDMLSDAGAGSVVSVPADPLVRARSRGRLEAAQSSSTLASAAGGGSARTRRPAEHGRDDGVGGSLGRSKTARARQPLSDATFLAATRQPLPPSEATLRQPTQSVLKPPLTGPASGQPRHRAPTQRTPPRRPTPPSESEATVVPAFVQAPPPTSSAVRAARVPLTVTADTPIAAVVDAPVGRVPSSRHAPRTAPTVDQAARVPIPPSTATVVQAARAPLPQSPAPTSAVPQNSQSARPGAKARLAAEVESDMLSPVHGFEPANIALPPSLTSQAGSAPVERSDKPATSVSAGVERNDNPAVVVDLQWQEANGHTHTTVLRPLPAAQPAPSVRPAQQASLLPPALQISSAPSPRQPLHRVPLPLPRPALTPANSTSTVDLLSALGPPADGHAEAAPGRSLGRKHRGDSAATLQTRFEPAMYPLPPSASDGTAQPEGGQVPQPTSLAPAAPQASLPSRPASKLAARAPAHPTLPSAATARNAFPVQTAAPTMLPTVADDAAPRSSPLPTPATMPRSALASSVAMHHHHEPVQFSPSSSSVADLHAAEEHVSFEVPSGSRGRLRVSLAWVPTRANRARRSATTSQATSPLSSPAPAPPAKSPSLAPSKQPHLEPIREHGAGPRAQSPGAAAKRDGPTSPPASPGYDRLWYGPNVQPFLPPTYAQQVFNAATPFAYPQPHAQWPTYRPPSPLESPRRPPSVEPSSDGERAPGLVPAGTPGFGPAPYGMVFDPRLGYPPVNWTSRLRNAFGGRGRDGEQPGHGVPGRPGPVGEWRRDVPSGQAPSVQQPAYHAPTVIRAPTVVPPMHAAHHPPTVLGPGPAMFPAPTMYGQPARKQPSMFDRLLLRRRVEDEYEYARRRARPQDAEYRAGYRDPLRTPYGLAELARGRSRTQAERDGAYDSRRPDRAGRGDKFGSSRPLGGAQGTRARAEQDMQSDRRARERAAARAAKDARRALRRAERDARDAARAQRAAARQRDGGRDRLDGAPRYAMGQGARGAGATGGTAGAGWAARALSLAAQPARAMAAPAPGPRPPRAAQTEGQWTRILSAVQGRGADRRGDRTERTGRGAYRPLPRETGRLGRDAATRDERRAGATARATSAARVQRDWRDAARTGRADEGGGGAWTGRAARPSTGRADDGLWGKLRRRVAGSY